MDKMKLQPEKNAPKADYPSYEAHRLSRRGMVGVAAALLLAQGCDDLKGCTMGECPAPAPPHPTETNTTAETPATNETNAAKIPSPGVPPPPPPPNTNRAPTP